MGDAGPLGGGGAPRQQGGIGANELKLLEFLKPFLGPDQAQQGGQFGGLVQKFFETTIQNAIDQQGQSKRLMDSLIQRIVDKEATEVFKLPSPGVRVKHTVTERPAA